MGCFNDPAWKVCRWWGGAVGWCGVVGLADTNYLYPARWGWINKQIKYTIKYKRTGNT